MKRFLLTAAIVAATLSSCSKNEIDYNLESADNAISFGVYTGTTTKAEATTSASIKDLYAGFYVFGFYTETSDFVGSGEETLSTLNFMHNQLVSYYDSSYDYDEESAPTNVTSENWYYTPVKYWSETYTDKYTFFAYAPDVDGIATPSVAIITGTPYIDFDLTESDGYLNDMVDLVADARIDVTSGKSSGDSVEAEEVSDVDFYLLHETTRLNLTASTNITSSGSKTETATSVVVTKVVFAGTTLYDEGRYTFAEADDELTSTSTDVDAIRGKWSDQSGSGSTLDLDLGTTTVEIGENGENVKQYSVTGVEVPSGTGTSVDLLGSDEYQFLIPVADKTTSAITITVTYDIVTEDDQLDGEYAASYNNVKTVTIPSGSEILLQGVAYTLNLEFALNEVVLTATVDDAWPTTETDTTTTYTSDDTEE